MEFCILHYDSEELIAEVKMPGSTFYFLAYQLGKLIIINPVEMVLWLREVIYIKHWIYLTLNNLTIEITYYKVVAI